jgi:hypothetical protein
MYFFMLFGHHNYDTYTSRNGDKILCHRATYSDGVRLSKDTYVQNDTGTYCTTSQQKRCFVEFPDKNPSIVRRLQ